MLLFAFVRFHNAFIRFHNALECFYMLLYMLYELEKLKCHPKLTADHVFTGFSLRKPVKILGVAASLSILLRIAKATSGSVSEV